MSAVDPTEMSVQDNDDDALDALLDGADLALKEKLEAALDVETGLAAILGNLSQPVLTRRRLAGQRTSPDCAAVNLVAPLACSDRLALRTHPALNFVWLARLCRTTSDTTHEITTDLEIGRGSTSALLRAIPRGHVRTRDFFDSKQLVRVHRSALARARSIVTTLRRALNEGPPRPLDLVDLDDVMDALNFALEFSSARIGVLTYADKHARDLAFHLTRAHTEDDVRSRAQAYLHARFLHNDRALGRAHASTGVLERALAQITQRHLDRYRATTRVSALLDEAFRRTDSESLAVTLIAVSEDLDDFGGADLRHADLDDIPLEGIRWSTATRWPEQWRERIAHNSVKLDGPTGLFEVRPGVEWLSKSPCTARDSSAQPGERRPPSTVAQ